MGYFKTKARMWLHRHPSLHAFYSQDKFRIITSPLRSLPDFVIIGAAKSGTTSLYDFVTRNQAIAPAVKKEVQYFSAHYKFGELWYRSNFPTNLSRYYFYKKTNQKLLSGEASPSYLFHQEIPAKMKEIMPDVRLIAILRNPVDRAYSAYHHMVRLNRETLPFEGAIELEEKVRVRGERRLGRDPSFDLNRRRTHSYLARGIYADQLENWFKYYDRKKILVLATDEFHKDPQRTLDRVFDFLGVPPLNVRGLRNLNVANYEEMSEDTRKLLVRYFEPHNEKLTRLLQRNFDWNK